MQCSRVVDLVKLVLFHRNRHETSVDIETSERIKSTSNRPRATLMCKTVTAGLNSRAGNVSDDIVGWVQVSKHSEMETVDYWFGKPSVT